MNPGIIDASLMGSRMADPKPQRPQPSLGPLGL